MARSALRELQAGLKYSFDRSQRIYGEGRTALLACARRMNAGMKPELRKAAPARVRS